MELLTVTIKTLSPVVLTAMNNAAVMTETRDYISGTVLRGVLAARYIDKNALGKNAQQNADFRKLFFGGLRFVDAYPVKDGKRSFVLPFSLQKAKVPVKASLQADEPLLDILRCEPEAGYKPLNGFGVAEGNRIAQVNVDKQIKLHMSRTGERERLSGRSLEGGIYNYEAIEAGQEFKGLIIGSRVELELLLKGLGLTGSGLDCRIGRSKYTEYGYCSITFDEIKGLTAEKTEGDTLYLRMETPWIPLSETAFSAKTQLENFAEKVRTALQVEDITVRKIIAKTENVANFVGTWGLKRAEQQALAAGSVFSLQKGSVWNENELNILSELLYQGQGARTEEGFGQLRIWNMKDPVLRSKHDNTVERRKVVSPKAREIAGSILLRRILADIRLLAEHDIGQLRGDLAAATHSFARLESMLGERRDLQQAKKRFQGKLQNELRDKSVLDKRLQNLTLKGRELKEILLGMAPMPYASYNFSEIIPAGLAEDAGFAVPNPESGILFYEYWLWFFRHGRKLAVARKEDK